MADEARRFYAVQFHPEVTHTVQGYARSLFGRGQIIVRQPDGVLWGGSDPRADGCAQALD
jgi:GMP synthase-like glutamine amidotransferase